MADLLTALGLVVTGVVDWFGDILALFATETILQLFLGMVIASWVFGKIMRLVIRR